jgi:hypothetical protein
MTRLYKIATLLSAVVLSGCGEKSAVQDITGPLASAKVRFFNFGVNAPGVHFYANDTKMAAISSTTGVESTAGVAYGSVTAGGFYSAITPGNYTLQGKIAAATDKDLAVSKVTATIADGKTYSMYISGFYDATAKTVEGFVVEDNYSATINYDLASVRFVNAISNSTPMIMYAKNTTTNAETAIGAAVAYKGAGAFADLPTGTYDLNLRSAGSTTNLVTRTGVQFVQGRVYTISARGDMTVVSTTATNRPFLDNTINR